MRTVTFAYPKSYLNDAQTHLAMAFDYALNELIIDPNLFGETFRRSEVAKLWSKGNPGVIAGTSGRELIESILEDRDKERTFPEPILKEERSPAYWTGWSLAYFQWLTSLSFDRILERISIQDWMEKYHPYHEMELSKLVDDLLSLFVQGETNLQRIRKQVGYTQKELSVKSGVHLRNIQMYEQRRNDINKAQVQHLSSLAKVLFCDMEDLTEPVLASLMTNDSSWDDLVELDDPEIAK